MIISFGIGSPASKSPGYSVRLPFHMPPSRKLKLADGKSFELFDHPCEITEEHHFYVLTVGGFLSEHEAEVFLRRVCAGLIWFGLKNSVGFRFNSVAAPVEQFDRPHPIVEGSSLASMAANNCWEGEYDGHYDDDKTIIRADHKRLVKFGAGSVSIRIDSPVSMFAKDMLEGMGGRAELVLSDPKLRLACEVYFSSHFESSSVATFLSRIMTLEILIPDTPASAQIRDMVDRFKAEITVARQREKSDSDKSEWDSLNGLLSWARFRSIKSRIRALVEEKLRGEYAIADLAEVSKEISRLYDLRSALVHKGEGDPNIIREGANRLNDIVPRVLKACFRESAGIGTA